MVRAAGIVLAAATAAASNTGPRLHIAGGNAQSATAYASGISADYWTTFAAPLRVSTGAVKNVAIRFTCASRGCTFPPQDQPDTVNRVDPTSYDVKVVNGTAEITLTIATAAPETVTVLAYPSTARAHAGAVAFTLTAR